MVQCVDCGSTIDKIPDWLSSVTVRFVCDNCRQKHPKPLAFVDLDVEPVEKAAAGEEEAEVISLDEAAALEEGEEDPGFDGGSGEME